MSKKKILILSSGGDAPGMNAAIRACVRTALHHDLEIFGCEHGFQGLMDQQIRPLHADSVANIIQRGGTALKTARCPEFTRPEAQSRYRSPSRPRRRRRRIPERRTTGRPSPALS